MNSLAEDAGGRAGLGAFALLLVLTFLAAGLGAIPSAGAPEFYEALAKPSWAPPPSVFGPVWTVLYTLIAVAAWLVVRARGWREARPALVLYGFQLAANALWTWLFFAWHLGSAALFDIVVLLLLIATMFWVFWRVRPLAGLLLVPYLAWVGFASVLTWSVWRLNPTLL